MIRRIKYCVPRKSQKIAMNKYLFCFVFILIFLLAGCHFPSKEDKIKLAMLETKFGDRYKFVLTIDGIYLEARLKKGARLKENDGEEIYRAFHGNEKELEEYYEKIERQLKNRSNREGFKFKAWYILNLYDASGNWLYQVQFNKENKLERNRSQEHY